MKKIRLTKERYKLKQRLFLWEWCEFCGHAYIECPECGNNGCNATWGKDGKCDVCSLSNQYSHLAFITNNYPKKQSDIKKFNEKIIEERYARI